MCVIESDWFTHGESTSKNDPWEDEYNDWGSSKNSKQFSYK